jgi:uncharacterized protein YdeI (BOF family)
MFHKIKHIRLFTILGIVAAMMLVATPIMAATLTIDEVSNQVKDTEVTITGTVDSSADNEYVITDSTGSISVEAGPSWYQAIDLTVGDTVTVTGEVDTGKDGTAVAQIDAFSITVDTGVVGEETTIVVREGPGKPAWAGAKAAGKGQNKNLD